jgi:hypothetical protein
MERTRQALLLRHVVVPWVLMGGKKDWVPKPPELIPLLCQATFRLLGTTIQCSLSPYKMLLQAVRVVPHHLLQSLLDRENKAP